MATSESRRIPIGLEQSATSKGRSKKLWWQEAPCLIKVDIKTGKVLVDNLHKLYDGSFKFKKVEEVDGIDQG